MNNQKSKIFSDDLTQEELMMICQMTNQMTNPIIPPLQSITPLDARPTDKHHKTKLCEFTGCQRKLNILTDYPCKCGKCFCNYHRFIDDHKCTYNYKEEHMKELAKRNPLIKRDKVDKI